MALQVVSVYAASGVRSSGYQLAIDISSTPTSCEKLANTAVDSQGFALGIFTSSPPVPATYGLPSPNDAGSAGSYDGALADYTAYQATCAISERMTQGTITLSSVSATEVAGTFDVVMTADGTADGGAGDHVTGSFTAPVCPAACHGNGDGGVTITVCNN
jgi:hypothetical protein